MKDRVPVYPGRVKLVPVSGLANTYDMTRADSATQEGTALNKANLLSDDTEKLIFGSSQNKTPNEALAELANGKAPKSHTHAAGDITSGTLPVANGGTGNTTGNAATATKLATARTIQTKLDSSEAESFDGSANVTPGVTGTLPVANGGTGAATLTSGRALIGNGTGAVAFRAITNNTKAESAVPASTNLITANTLRYALNRTTATTGADTNYGTYMVRSVAAGTTDLTAGTSSLTSGAIYVVYE